MGKIIINKEFCKGCGLCVDACKLGLLKIGKEINAVGDHYAVQNDAAKCIGCAFCAMMCPEAAIEVYR